MWFRCGYFTSRIPFVSVPAPFSVGDYRVTPSCILAVLSAFTLVILLIFRRYFGYFILINLLFVLRSFRCDGVMCSCGSPLRFPQ